MLRHQPEQFTFLNGDQPETLRLRPTPATVEALRTLAETSVTSADAQALWRQVSLDRPVIQEDGSLILDGAPIPRSTWRQTCAEMLTQYEALRPEPSAEESAQALAQAAQEYPIGCRVQHYKGPIYQVLYHALDSHGQVEVVYQRVGEDSIYTRLVSQWSDLVHYQGRDCRRFTRQ